MYYICKFSDSWSIYDGLKSLSRPLDKNEVECLKQLFPGLLGDTSKILAAIQISSIQPNKLMQLTNNEKKETTRPLKEIVKT